MGGGVKTISYVFRRIPISSVCGGGVILENIVIFVSKLTVSAAKARQKAGRPLLMRAFAAETVNFDTKNHNIFQNNTPPQ